jgi:tetratricopeptide (TPR) repeat protein
MMKIAAAFILGGMALLSVFSAAAQDNRKQAMIACLEAEGAPESIVAGCSWLLESKNQLTDHLRLSAYLQRAVGYNHLGDFPLALEDIDRAIEMSPGASKLHQFRGVTFIQLGEYSRAVRALTRAIELDEQNAEAWFYLGLSHAKLEDYEQAIADYSRAIELQPDFPTAINNRGESYLQIGDCERALIDFNTSLELIPDSGLAYVNRAECHYQLGNAEAALADHRRSIELISDDANIYNLSCWTKGLLGHGESALADCNEALRLEPGVAAYRDSRALAYYRLEQFDLALTDAMAAMEAPTWENYILRAAIYQRQGKEKLAEADYRKAKRLQRDQEKLQQRVRVLGWESGKITQ